MNNQRRKQISEILNVLTEAKEQVDDVAEQEREYADCMPENLQSSERYDTACEAADNLEEAASLFDDIIDYLEQARGE